MPSMQLSSTLAFLVDAASAAPGPDRLLAEIGARLAADGLPLAGGALTLAVPHPLIARRTWLWRADSGEVIEAFGFVAAGFASAGAASPGDDAGRRWLAALAAGSVHEDAVGSGPDAPSLGWIGPDAFTPDEVTTLRETARFAAAPLAALAARATLSAALEAYLGRRSAARVLAGPLRRDVGETIEAALLYADLRGFTALSESNPPAAVIAALDAWFDRIAGAVHAFGGENLPGRRRAA
jgi:adenylate cyclase